MNYETIIVEKKEGVAKITLNRPQALNAMSEKLLAELEDALRDAGADDDVQVVILTGAGRAFSAGMDLKELTTRAERKVDSVQLLQGVPKAIENLEKPLIAAVNGHCYTGAFELALMCDMIIASENAIFCDTHARFGLVHGWGGSQRLPRLIGPMKARELIFTSEPVKADEAGRIGLVNKVVPAGELDKEVSELAAKIIKNNQTSIRVIKSLIKQGMKVDLKSGLEIEADAFMKRHP